MFLTSKELPEKYKNDVWEILSANDAEFLPPLSARYDTTQESLSGGKISAAGPKKYFESICCQNFIFAVEDGKVAGFLSYIPRYSVKTAEGEENCAYVSTVIVRPEFRKRGLTRGMYEELFKAESGKNTATRTWSTNAAHIGLLKKLGFDEVLRIENDRGAGIDTVYYIKRGK